MEVAKAHSWVKLELDVSSFDASKFASHIERCLREGINFSRISDLGDDDLNRGRLFELNRECSADIPGRGVFYTREEYFVERIAVTTYNPRGVMIARQGGQWLGMAAISDCREEGYVFSAMTGVRKDFRGRGIAMAMKVLGVSFVRECGVDVVRTVHHPENSSMIALNKRLGYVEGQWDYP
jgi:RimJ/RimL family protein N-acetyltransferase